MRPRFVDELDKEGCATEKNQEICWMPVGGPKKYGQNDLVSRCWTTVDGETQCIQCFEPTIR